jgi:flagellar assembly factor FliW
MECATDSGKATLVNSPRFGEFAYRETDVIEFPWGLRGFAGLRRWLFLSLESHPTFVWLQSLDDLSVALPAANPWMIFEDYDPEVPPYAFLALDIQGAADFTYLCVVIVNPGAAEMTMNLAAPIVVNLRTRKAHQVDLAGRSYSVRQPIPRRSDEQALTATAS